MRYVKGGLAILALLAMIIFAAQNLAAVDVSFLSWTMKIPNFLLIVATYALGMLTGAWLFDFLKFLLSSKKATEKE